MNPLKKIDTIIQENILNNDIFIIFNAS
jgi:hypothetical protein